MRNFGNRRLVNHILDNSSPFRCPNKSLFRVRGHVMDTKRTAQGNHLSCHPRSTYCLPQSTPQLSTSVRRPQYAPSCSTAVLRSDCTPRDQNSGSSSGFIRLGRSGIKSSFSRSNRLLPLLELLCHCSESVITCLQSELICLLSLARSYSAKRGVGKLAYAVQHSWTTLCGN